MRDLEKILKQYGLERYADVFRANRIDLDVIHLITETDLENLGIPLGDRKRILQIANDIAGKHELDSTRAKAPTGAVSVSDKHPTSGSTEIRQISVLFADLVGSTELAARFDVEEYHTTLRKFHECCTDIVEELHGFPARYIGDAILACFGYPKAAEDDGVRAATAGSQIIEQVPHIETPIGVSLCARVGIATGVAMTGDLMGEGADSFGPATGATLSLAARLQTLAEPGTLLVDDQTRQLLDTGFHCTNLGERQFKGFAEEKRVWRVERSTEQTALLRRTPRGHLTSLVGREEELDLLKLRWNSARRKGCIVLVSGEAGIGKSRLVNEFAEQADLPDGRILRMECSANETLRPLHPIIRGIEAVAGVTGIRDQAARLGRLRAWVDRDLRLSPRAADVLARLLLPTKDGDAAVDRTSMKERKVILFETIFQSIERLGLEAPILCVLEDLHWIDPTTEEFLDHLVERIGPLRAMIVCTYRPDYQAKFVGEPRVSLITLSRLEQEQSADLMREVLGGAELSPDVTEEIIARTDGIPLFLEELTKSALESESLPRRAEPRVEDSSKANALTLPTTLLGSLLARLDRVPQVHRIAPIGAAIGRTFPHDLLIRVTGLAEEEAAPILADLMSSGLLIQLGQGAEAKYSFKHALVQDAAYQTLPKSHRRLVHQRVGETLESLGTASTENHPEILARHFFAAENFEKACVYWRSAATEAIRSSASKEAVAYIHSALEVNERTEPGHARRDREIELREALYVPLQVTNWGSSEIAQNMERLRELRIERGDGEELLDVLHALSGYNIICGKVSAARDLAQEILDRYGDSDNVAEVLGLRCLGFCSFLAGDFDNAIAELNAAISLCDSIDEERMRRFYQADTSLISKSIICWALALKGEIQKMKELEAEIIFAVEECADRWTKVYSLTLIASAHQVAGDTENCIKCVNRALPIAEELESRYWTGWCKLLTGWVLAITGDALTGIREIEDGVEMYGSTGSMQVLPYAKMLCAEAYLANGRSDEAMLIFENLRFAREPAEVRYIDRILERLIRKADLTKE